MTSRTPFVRPTATPAEDALSPVAGSRGDLLIWLRDSRTHGVPLLPIGPGYARSAVRFYGRLPDRENAERLPAPIGVDRSTITFTLRRVVLAGPLPANSTALFYRVDSTRGHGKIDRHELHQWTPDPEETGFNPSVLASLPVLHPGDWITLEGTTRFHHPGLRKDRNNEGQYRAYRMRVPAPTNEQRLPCTLALLLRTTWLPVEKPTWIRVVPGNPLQQGYAPPPAQDKQQSTPETHRTPCGDPHE